MKSSFFFIIPLLLSAQLWGQGGDKMPPFNGLTKKQIDAIEAVMAPLRTKVENTLQQQEPSLYKAYQADMKALIELKDLKQKEAALSQLKAKYYPFIKQGYAMANIDENQAKSLISNILKGSIYKITYAEFLGVTGTYQSPPSPPVTNNCIELKCPMDAKTELRTDLFNTDNLPVAENCATLSTSGTNAIISGVDHLAATGKNVSVQSNINRVEISGQADYFLYGSVFAFLGSSYIDSSIGYQIQGPGVDILIPHISKWAISAVIGMNTIYTESASTNSMSGSFIPSQSGGNYKIQVYTRSFAIGALGTGVSRANSDLKSPIKVCQIK